MSNQQKYGGPAFSIPQSETHDTWPGMSLRDYFAGKALAGLMAKGADLVLTPCEIAKEAYAIADAMLKAREALS